MHAGRMANSDARRGDRGGKQAACFDLAARVSFIEASMVNRVIM